MTTAPINIPQPQSYEPVKQALKEKYRQVEEIDGEVLILEYPRKDPETQKISYQVKVKLHLKPENTDRNGYQVLLFGKGKDEKDKKGAFKDLIVKLGLTASKTSDERALRQLAHNAVMTRYNTIANVATLKEDVRDGKAIVEVKVKNEVTLADVTGDSLKEAYEKAKPSP